MKKVKHARDSSTTNLYPANKGSGGSWVRGHGLAVGREKEREREKKKNLFWGSYSGSFVGNVLLG